MGAPEHSPVKTVAMGERTVEKRVVEEKVVAGKAAERVVGWVEKREVEEKAEARALRYHNSAKSTQSP